MIPGKSKIGKYVILEELGKGGFATVYRATDTSLDRDIALKILSSQLLDDPNFVANFRQEARTQAGLRHQAIVTIYEVESLEGRFYIAMELINGPNLANALRGSSGRSWEATLDLLKPLTDGLDYAHKQNIIHCDLKPSNILIDPQRGPLLSDFGFARLMNQNTASTRLSSRSLSPAGTPAYVAPEIWDGQEPSGASDVYALGCIAYEILTGNMLFDGKSLFQIVGQHKQGPNLAITWPKDVPAGIEDVLATALAHEPQARYQSAGAFWQALHDLGASTRAIPIPAVPAPVAERAVPVPAVPAPVAAPPSSRTKTHTPPQRPKKRFGLVAGLVAAGLLLAAAAGLGLRLTKGNTATSPTMPPNEPTLATPPKLTSAARAAAPAAPTTTAAPPTTAVPTTAVPSPTGTPAPTIAPSSPAVPPTDVPPPPPSPVPTPTQTPAPATRSVLPPTPVKPTSTPKSAATPTSAPTVAPTDAPVASGAVLSVGRGSYFQGSADFEVNSNKSADGSCIEGRILRADGGLFKSFGLLVDKRGSSLEPQKNLASGTYGICGLSAGEWGVAIYEAGGTDIPTGEQAAHQVRVRLSGTPGEVAYINFRALVALGGPTETPKPQASSYDGTWSGTLSGNTTTGSFKGRFRMEVRSGAVYRISIDGPSCIFETYPNFPNGQPISGGAFALSGNPANPQTGVDSSIYFNASGSFSSSTQASGRLDAVQNGTGCIDASWNASR